MLRRVPVPRGALRVSLLLALTAGGGGVLLSAGDPSPAVAASGLAPGCVAPAPKAAGAGSSRAAVKRLVRSVSTNLTREPKVRPPKGKAPKRLVKDDVVRCGKGARVSRGDTAVYRYTMHVWGGKRTPGDSSWAHDPSTVSFRLSKGSLIDGWVEGIPGMRVGGRRVLVVPPSEAYGSESVAGVPKNSTLIFVIDLVSVS